MDILAEIDQDARGIADALYHHQKVTMAERRLLVLAWFGNLVDVYKYYVSEAAMHPRRSRASPRILNDRELMLSCRSITIRLSGSRTATYPSMVRFCMWYSTGCATNTESSQSYCRSCQSRQATASQIRVNSLASMSTTRKTCAPTK